MGSGLLAVGPFGFVLPWFVYYFKDVPSLNSTTFLGISMSSKTMTYLLGCQVILGTMSNTVMAISSLVAGMLLRSNFLWLQNWLVVPKFLAKTSQMLFGWLIDSPAPEQGAIGATLEIQRSQQMEVLEQHLIQQQARANVRRIPNQNMRQRAPALPPQAVPEPSEG